MKWHVISHYSGFLALVAFLLNVMLPFFAVYNAPTISLTESTYSAFFGEKILLCTEAGFELVSIEDIRSGAKTPKPHPDYECGLCYVHAHGFGNALFADAAIAPLPVNHYQYIHFSTYTAPLGHMLQRSAPTRAPPAFLA